MRIGELAAATGTDVETVRYYEREGLLPTPARSPNGYRAYGPAHLERLAFVRHCRSLDMPLADVRRLLALLDCPTTGCDGANTLVERQLERVRARIASLAALERQLAALRARCAAPGDSAHCGILGELAQAAQGEACACHGAAPQARQSRPARANRARAAKARPAPMTSPPGDPVSAGPGRRPR